MTIREAHKVMDEIETRLEIEFPDTEILIHPDPEGLVNEQGAAAEDVLPHTCDVEEYLAANPEEGKP
jgi:ferrous-iron efflux pump FieF